MFPQLGGSQINLQQFKSDMPSTNCHAGYPTGLVLSADHSLVGDSQCPLSPSNQFMYETDNSAYTGLNQSPPTGLLASNYPDYDAISPSVEGLTFDSYDFMSYVYTGGGNGNGFGDGGDNIGMSSGDKLIEHELKVVDSGPTLTQLNTDNLEMNFFYDIDVLCDLPTDQVLDYMKTVGGTLEAVSSTPCTVITPVRPPAMPPSSNSLLFPLQTSQLSSQPTASAMCTASAASSLCRPTATVTGKRPLSPEPTSGSSSTSSMLLAALTGKTANLNWNWEEIESFLQSEEDQRVASSVTSSNTEQPNKKRKTESTNSAADIINGALDVKGEAQTIGNAFHDEDDVDYDDDDDDADSCLSDNDITYNDADDDDDDQLSFLLDSVSASRKEKTYFWQYNTQSKGPKGKRLCRAVQDDDPYVLHDFEDPVFDAELQAYASPRYRHNGKARRGDGNDVTPNPGKLFSIGKELKKLGQLINAMTTSSEMSSAVRARTLREKNKYASRVCRLKKKAQHEANKIKLHGLEHEHRQLAKVLTTIRKELIQRVTESLGSDGEKLSSKLDTQIQTHLSIMTAGHTTEYVNSVLAKVAAGDRSGGLIYEDCC